MSTKIDHRGRGLRVGIIRLFGIACFGLAAAVSADDSLLSHRYRVVDNCNAVVDLRTHLMWQRCALGQVWNGQTCTGRAVRQDWSSAVRQQNQLCGFSDWNLPTFADLEGLLTEDGMPAIDPLVFPNTPPASFWSASVNDMDSRQAWFVNFGKGNGQHTYKDASFHVRLVRMAN